MKKKVADQHRSVEGRKEQHHHDDNTRSGGDTRIGSARSGESSSSSDNIRIGVSSSGDDHSLGEDEGRTGRNDNVEKATSSSTGAVENSGIGGGSNKEKPVDGLFKPVACDR